MPEETTEECVFWAPEGPRVAVDRDEYLGYVLNISDLNPEQHLTWAMSKEELMKLASGLIEYIKNS